MKFQIIVPPSTIGSSNYPPYGAMYIAAALRQEGHAVRIENGDTDKLDDAELCRRVREFRPDIVGFSAIVATSYKYVKEASALIRREFPDMIIMVGGGLAAASDVLLAHTSVDYVLIGESDVTVKELVRFLAKGADCGNVDGIAFKRDGSIIKTSPRRPISDIDSLPYPAFDLIDMDRYMIDVKRFVKGFFYYKDVDPRLFQSGRSKKILRVPLSRGCINACTFCYRPVRGLRHFSVKYLFDYIEYMMERFRVNVFSFGDECFMSSKEYGWEFIAEIKRRKLDIMFHIMGTKVETVDEKLLQALKGAGCFFIEYGFESGSQKMLDVMEKKVTVARNLEAARATKAAGLFTVPTIVLGMPGETDETVRETIEFMKKLDYGSGWYQYTYAFAVPGTPLYEYGRLTHRIPDEDRYLEAIYRATPTHFIESPDFVNFTAEPIGTVRRWPVMIKEELLKHYSRNKLDYLIRKYLRSEIFFFYMKRNGIRKTLQKILKSLSGLKTGAGAAVPQDVRYDAAVGGERGESLRKVIDRLKERSEEGLYIKASN